jgi:hypothetical protein
MNHSWRKFRPQHCGIQWGYHAGMEIAETAAINPGWTSGDERVGRYPYNLITDVVSLRTERRFNTGRLGEWHLKPTTPVILMLTEISSSVLLPPESTFTGKNNLMENSIIVDSGRMSVRPSNPPAQTHRTGRPPIT